MRLEPLLILALVACNGSTDAPGVVEVSAAPRIKAKGGPIWKTDLSRSLGLALTDVCVELDQYDCVEVAHKITMGGVEPEVLGIDEPLANPPASAPIAYDRVALSACATRFERDRAGEGFLFEEVIDSYSAGNRRIVADRLVQKLLARDATRDERDALVDLHDALEPLSSDLVADWSIGACLIVATSTEALFY